MGGGGGGSTGDPATGGNGGGDEGNAGSNSRNGRAGAVELKPQEVREKEILALDLHYKVDLAVMLVLVVVDIMVEVVEDPSGTISDGAGGGGSGIYWCVTDGTNTTGGGTRNLWYIWCGWYIPN